MPINQNQKPDTCYYGVLIDPQFFPEVMCAVANVF